MSLGTGANPRGNVVVLCILDKPELEALEAAFDSCASFTAVKDTSLRYLESVFSIDTRNGENRTVRLACVDKRGNLAAAIKARQLLHRFNPSLLLVVGIAGGMNPKKVNRGDVVIQNDVFYHVYSKMDERGKWVSESPPTPKIPRLAAYTRKFIRRDTVFAAASQFKPDENAERAAKSNKAPAKIYPGKYLITDYTLDFKSQREKFINEHDREIIAIDTESYGVLCAAQDYLAEDETKDLSLNVVVMRGISDFAADKGRSDTETGADWRKYAARNAACAALDFIAGLTEADAFALVGPKT